MRQRRGGPMCVQAQHAAPFNDGAPMLMNYLPVLIFLAIAALLAAMMLSMGSVLGRLSVRHRADAQKLSPYECGFEPFEDNRVKFDVRYYLVAILFIIFDLEIAFLFPWAVSLNRTGGFGLIVMGIFLLILDRLRL